jgi:hypothetical protein
MGADNNPSTVVFPLKTDELYEVVVCIDVKETLDLPTTDTYTFSLSTNVQVVEIISPTCINIMIFVSEIRYFPVLLMRWMYE